MKAYIALSLSHRKLLAAEISSIMDTLKANAITGFAFVDQYQFNDMQSKQMMQQAMQDIDNCDILIAETSHKAIGIGVEAGYAKEGGKTIIYVRNANAAHSTTVAGISDYQIVYADNIDLSLQLNNILQKIIS